MSCLQRLNLLPACHPETAYETYHVERSTLELTLHGQGLRRAQRKLDKAYNWLSSPWARAQHDAKMLSKSQLLTQVGDCRKDPFHDCDTVSSGRGHLRLTDRPTYVYLIVCIATKGVGHEGFEEPVRAGRATPLGTDIVLCCNQSFAPPPSHTSVPLMSRSCGLSILSVLWPTWTLRRFS